MGNILLIVAMIILLFCFLRFVEAKYLAGTADQKPMKEHARDICMVCFSSFVACFCYFTFEQHFNYFLNIVTDTQTLNPNNVRVFTEEPGF